MPTCPTNTINDLLYKNTSWRIGLVVTAGCTLIACILSFKLLLNHWRNFNQPKIQIPQTRLIFMVPIYAIGSAITYYSPDLSVYMTLLTSCYEAFLIWNFFTLLTLYVSEVETELKAKLAQMERQRLPIFRCIEVSPGHPIFLAYCKAGVIQLVVVRLLLTVISLFAEWFGKFCESSSSPQFFHIYYQVFTTISLLIAMYALLTFYQTVHHEIKRAGTFSQFLAVKLAIFVQLLITIVVQLFVKTGKIVGNDIVTTNQYAILVTSVLICKEMLIVAIFHWWAFSATPFVITGSNTDTVKSFKSSLNFSD
ncbi:hypothetical protein HK103_003262, partial [Boothiomyces macroporosus]